MLFLNKDEKWNVARNALISPGRCFFLLRTEYGFVWTKVQSVSKIWHFRFLKMSVNERESFEFPNNTCHCPPPTNRLVKSSVTKLYPEQISKTSHCCSGPHLTYLDWCERWCNSDIFIAKTMSQVWSLTQFHLLFFPILASAYGLNGYPWCGSFLHK